MSEALTEVCRSCLSVPADRPRYLGRAAEVGADMLMLDLEDSLAPERKAEGRAGAVEALRTHAYAGRFRAVRVNPVESPWALDDLLTVVAGAGRRLHGIVLPKVESVATLHWADLLLGQLERRHHLPRLRLDIQIETALGLERAGQLAGASDRLRALHLGAGDFAASAGLPGLVIGEEEGATAGLWTVVRTRLLVAARAHGLLVLDGPYARFRDAEGLRRTARLAAGLGFDGKWAIHPDQVAILHEVFSPTQDEVDRAGTILKALERAVEARASAAVDFEGEMIDEATRKMAARTVARGQRAGLIPR
ncbi:MAG: HpcH/HpaI aldolase/citrate lyase family protein [Candidatus Dormibacteraceae bacterium]